MPKDPFFKGLGDALGGIPLDSIQPSDELAATKVDITTLTSYSLLPKQRKTIIVPGSPSIWKPPITPREIKPDAGTSPMDPNRHVFPKCPLEPLFRALSLAQPGMKMNDIDLVTDRRNLRLLLGFASGRKSSFRIDVEVVNDTELFYCWTPRALTYINRDSMTHNRVIRYMFGDVKIILRYEVDGCTGSDDDVRKGMPAPGRSEKTPTGYTVIRWGNLVAPCRIIEIKTRAVGKNLDVSKNTEQLWFSQTPILCAGHYDGAGTFTSITKGNLLRMGKLKEWEESHQEQLKKLAALLRVIVELAWTATWKKCRLVSSGGTLKIFSLVDQNDKGLPVDLQSMWE